MARKPKSLNVCNCIAIANKKLAESNAALKTHLQFSFSTGSSRLVMGLPIEKIDAKNRKPLPFFPMAYCPICGKAQFPKDATKAKPKAASKGGAS